LPQNVDAEALAPVPGTGEIWLAAATVIGTSRANASRPLLLRFVPG
jgi:hypothetical protein